MGGIGQGRGGGDAGTKAGARAKRVFEYDDDAEAESCEDAGGKCGGPTHGAETDVHSKRQIKRERATRPAGNDMMADIIRLPTISDASRRRWPPMGVAIKTPQVWSLEQQRD